MRRRFDRRTAFWFFAVASLAVPAALLARKAFRPEFPELPPLPVLELNDNDRIMVLAPHPDDEIIGCGGVIQEAVRRSLPIQIVFFTNGDFNQWSFLVYRRRIVLSPSEIQIMGMTRQDEALSAAAELGVPSDNVIFLGYPDFGTFTILRSYWGTRQPYRSILSRANHVPYSTAFRPGAMYKGEDILFDLEKVIGDFKPTKIFVSHPADHHPDHQALYLFTRVALWDLKMDPAPDIFPYLVHFRRWPKPRGYYPDCGLVPPLDSLPNVLWCQNPLSEEEIERKHEALMRHQTQFRGNAKYLLSFIRTNEIFGGYLDTIFPAAVSTAQLSEHSPLPPEEVPEELVEEEIESFIGLEERAIQVRDGVLEIAVGTTKRLGRDARMSVYAFGYRSDIPFADMPKLHIQVDSTGYSVSDKGSVLPLDSIKVQRAARMITICIPTQLLNNPNYVLTGAKSFFEEVPLDSLSWRVLVLGDSS